MPRRRDVHGHFVGKTAHPGVSAGEPSDDVRQNDPGDEDLATPGPERPADAAAAEDAEGCESSRSPSPCGQSLDVLLDDLPCAEVLPSSEDEGDGNDGAPPATTPDPQADQPESESGVRDLAERETRESPEPVPALGAFADPILDELFGDLPVPEELHPLPDFDVPALAVAEDDNVPSRHDLAEAFDDDPDAAYGGPFARVNLDFLNNVPILDMSSDEETTPRRKRGRGRSLSESEYTPSASTEELGRRRAKSEAKVAYCDAREEKHATGAQMRALATVMHTVEELNLEVGAMTAQNTLAEAQAKVKKFAESNYKILRERFKIADVARQKNWLVAEKFREILQDAEDPRIQEAERQLEKERASSAKKAKAATPVKPPPKSRPAAAPVSHEPSLTEQLVTLQNIASIVRPNPDGSTASSASGSSQSQASGASQAPRKCSICGATDHLLPACPKNKKNQPSSQ